MTVAYRAIDPEHFDEFVSVDTVSFGDPADPPWPDTWPRTELDRALGAFDAGRLVGIGRAYSFELTVPGGRTVPVAAISSVAALPTHRRRGVTRGMLAALEAAARERGEVAAVLMASEGGIYGRFGYGVATWGLSARVVRTAGLLASEVPGARGSVELVARDRWQDVFPAVYDRARLGRAGMVSRPPSWWPTVLAQRTAGPGGLYAVTHRSSGGTLDGYALYRVSGDSDDGLPAKRLTVVDLTTVTDEARVELWRFLLDLDLVADVEADTLPVDDPLRFVLADPRRLRVRSVNDRLWLKPLDARSLLAAREVGPGDPVTVQLVDGNGVAGVRLLLGGGGPEPLRPPATTEAELVLGPAELGAVALGGTTCTQLAAAGRLAEQEPGAVRRADRLLTTVPAPATLSWF